MGGNEPIVGVLALQGDFDKHQQCLHSLGAATIPIRTPAELEAVDALVLPGGESTVLLRMCGGELREALYERISNGLPTLATCAGLIFIAERVDNPRQESMKLLDVHVLRNAYGRQKDSFLSGELLLTEEGRTELGSAAPEALRGVFIRAPKITHAGSKVEVLCRLRKEPVLVRQGAVIGATFHPELGDQPSRIHQLLLERC